MASRSYLDIPFGPYLPDLGGTPSPQTPGYLTDAVNVRLTPTGYRGMPTFETFGAATMGTGTPIGGGFYTLTGTGRYFGISDSSLYQSVTLSSWAENTPVSGAVTQYSQFVQFDDYLVLIDINDISYKDLNDLSTVDFTALPGSPPNARVGGRIRQHLVLGALIGDNESAVQWCAIGDIENWPTPGSSSALSTQAGREDLDGSYGKIRALLGGEKFGIIAQEFALTRMTYVGGSTVYEFDTFETKYGAGAVNSADGAGYPPFVQIGPAQWIWLNEHGVFVTDGYSVRNISSGRVEVALFLDALSSVSAPLDRAARGVYDSRRRLVMFRTDGGDSNNLQLCYSIETDSFSFHQGTDFYSPFEGRVSDTDFTSVIYSFGSDRVLRRLAAGSPAIAMQTGYIELDPGYKVQLHSAHLLGAGVPGSLTLAYKSTSLLSAADLSQSSFTSLTANSRGQKATGRATDQYFAFRITGTGAESQLIQGIRVYFDRGEPAT